MKVIDFRLRPPYKEFNNDWYFGEGVLKDFSYRLNQPSAPSAVQRSMELLLQEMDDSGIDMGVVMGRYSFGAAQNGADAIAGIPNSTVSELVERYPERFIGMISVNIEERLDKAFREIDQYVLHGNCQGVVIDTGYAAGPINFSDATLYPLYDYCQRNDVPLSLGTALVYRNLESASAQFIDKVAEDFPDLRMVIGHGGWPYVTESCWVAFKRPNVYLSPDLFLYGAPGWLDYLSGIKNHLKDKMIFGTAYPFASFEESIKYIKNCELNETVYESYMGKNAMDFFRMND